MCLPVSLFPRSSDDEMTYTSVHIEHSAEGVGVLYYIRIQAESDLLQSLLIVGSCTYVRRFGHNNQILASVPDVLQSQDSVMKIRLISCLLLLLKLDEEFWVFFFSLTGNFSSGITPRYSLLK